MQTEIITYSPVEISLSDDGNRKITGYYTRYFDANNPESTQYRVNNYILRIEKGALDHTDTSETELRYNHNPDFVMGNAATGLQLSLTPQGGTYSHAWDDTDPEFTRIEKKLQKNLIAGSSMRFKDAAFEWKKENNERIMWIYSFKTLVDVGPVCRPAISGTGQPLILDASYDIEAEYKRWLQTQTLLLRMKM